MQFTWTGHGAPIVPTVALKFQVQGDEVLVVGERTDENYGGGPYILLHIGEGSVRISGPYILLHIGEGGVRINTNGIRALGLLPQHPDVAFEDINGRKA